MAEEERKYPNYYFKILFFCLVTTFPYSVGRHTCAHTTPKRHEVVHNVHIEPAHVVKKRSLDQPLRIHLEYESSVHKLPSAERNLVQNDLIPSSVHYWEKTLQVRPTSAPIRLLRQCASERVRYQDSGDPSPYCVDGCVADTKCGETLVPADHLEACKEARTADAYRSVGTRGPGVAGADFVLYVSAYDTDRCGVGTTVAYTAYCQLEAALDRPIAGYVNLCPRAISTLPHDLHQMHATIKHEILHALGFAAGLFAFYRDPAGEPLTLRSPSTGKPDFNEELQVYQWSDKVVRKVTRDWETITGNVQHTVQMVVTPNVLREVRVHFNCSTLEGAELEDQGALGTALTHWEKRVFENEVMTGTYTQNPLISRITLALMEDTGWYKVDYSQAEELSWGRGLGCQFVQNSCYHWIKTRTQSGDSVHPFCSRVKPAGGLRTECATRREAVTLCNLSLYNATMQTKYQNFRSIEGVPASEVSRYAGAVDLADYCPYIQEFNWKKGETVVRGSRCAIEDNNADPEINYTLERYGDSSLCFEHETPWRIQHCNTVHDIEHWGSGCYQYRCVSGSGLHITVGSTTYRCVRAGQVLRVREVLAGWLHLGNVVCPPCNDICQRHGILCPSEEAASPVDPPVSTDIRAPCGGGTTTHQPTIRATSLLLIAIATVTLS